MLAELARGRERALARQLRVSPDAIARRLVDLLPSVATAVAVGRDEVGADCAAGRIPLKDLLQDLEDCLIVLMLCGSRSYREAAGWLGLNEATLRSKMRKRHIRSPRLRRRANA